MQSVPPEEKQDIETYELDTWVKQNTERYMSLARQVNEAMCNALEMKSGTAITEYYECVEFIRYTLHLDQRLFKWLNDRTFPVHATDKYKEKISILSKMLADIIWVELKHEQG